MDEDLTILERLGNPIVPLTEEDRQFPADVPASETNPDIFLHMEDQEYPERKYAGFWHDFYVNYDGYHSSLEPAWYDDRGNRVDLRRGSQWSLFDYSSADFDETQGQLWSSYSLFGGGVPGLTHLFRARSQDTEKTWMFANRPVISQSSGSSNPTVKEVGVRYSPYSYTSIGWSYSEEFFSTKMAIVGGYLHRDLKPEILRNGWWTPTVMYLWRNSLPYDAPYYNEFFHQWHIYTNGFNSHGEYGNIEAIAEFNRHFEPHLHMKNMVQAAKEMTVIPPVVTLEHIETLSGTDTGDPSTGESGHDHITSHGYLQKFGDDFQVRVKVHPLDLQGLPVEVHWAMNHGENTTTVVDEGNNTYLITIPHNPDLPAGRTTLIVWGDNGVTAGNPAAINVSRSDDTFFGDNEPERDWTPTVTQPTGLTDVRILPGETVTWDVFSYAPSGFPVSFIKWQGPGEMDGNYFQWDVPLNEPEGEHWVVIVGSDGTNGLTFSGSSAKISVVAVKAVAEVSRSTAETGEALMFSSAGSGDKDGNAISSYLWHFGDGNTSSLADPSHAYSSPGVYQVSLTVTTPLGSDTVESWLEIFPAGWDVSQYNGWDDTGLTPGWWELLNATTTTTDFGDTFKFSSNKGAAAPSHLLSQNALPTPLVLETTFDLGSTWPGFFHIFDIAVGRSSRNQPVTLSEYSVSGGAGAELALLTANDGDNGITLRLYLEDDPNHPGKLLISGSVRTPDGPKFFALDNRDPGDGEMGFLDPTDIGDVRIRDFRIWQPDVDSDAPSMEVLDENGLVLSSGHYSNWALRYLENDSLSSVIEFPSPDAPGGSTERTLTIRNTGGAPLNLGGLNPFITIEGDSDPFSVVVAPTSVIPAGGETQFTIAYTPSADQEAVSAGALIANDDPTRSAGNGFQIVLRGQPNLSAPLYVEGRNVAIADGDSTPDLFDGTDFGALADGHSSTQDYLLYHNGAGVLNITDVEISGDPSFSVDAAPRATLEAYESSRLRIAFAPVGAGSKTATVTISTDEVSNSTFTFQIQGTGLGAVAPEIQITGAGQVIANGDTSPSSTDGTDFGDAPFAPDSPAGIKRHTFAIENTGDYLLRLTGNFPQATLSGPDADAFFIYRDPAQAVHPGMTAEFIVAFQPQRLGSHSATLTVANDDADEPAYSFALSGNGIGSPAIDVTDDRGWQIRNGDPYPSIDQNTNLGQLNSTGSLNATFHIVNQGSATLQITDVTLSGSGASSFSVNSPFSVAAGATGNLVVTYTPATAGASEATLAISSNDPQNPQWSFAIQGELSGMNNVGSRGVDRGLKESSEFNGHAWCDYDKDGDLDLLLTGSFAINTSDPDSLTNLYGKTFLYTNNGSGQFTSSSPGLPDVLDSDADWGDYDKDGDLDLVISGLSGIYTSEETKVTEVYRNDGGQFFPLNAGLPLISDCKVRWVDVNNDGLLDIFFTGNTAARRAAPNPSTRIFLNDGAGSFPDSGIVFAKNFYQADAEWTDFNNDGYPDLLIVGWTSAVSATPREVRIEKNNGDGTFTSIALEIASQATSASWGDVNQDGLLDVFCNGGTTEDYVRAFIQNPDGGFSEEEFTDGTTNAVFELQAGDLNGNGWADLALHQQSGDWFLTTAYNQALEPPDMAVGGEIDNAGKGALAIGDFNGDGVNDIWNSGRSSSSDGTSESAFLFGLGTPNLPPSAPTQITAEVAGDGASILFGWSPGVDPESGSSNNVRYSIRIGTAPDIGDIVAGFADADTGYRQVPRLGEIGGTSYRLHRTLPPGIYYVAVQSVDAAFTGSSWTEVEFRVGDPVNPVDDAFTFSEVQSPVTLDVLANDVVTAFGQIDSFTQPAYGTVTYGDDSRELIYLPEGYWGQHGPETFTYTVRDDTEDGEVLAHGAVTLTITPALTQTDDTSPRTLDGIGLDAGQFAGRVRTSGDLQLQAKAAGLISVAEDKAVFASEERSGDFIETLRLRDLAGPAGSRIGLMARTGTNPDAAFAQISVTPDMQYTYNWRPADQGTSTAETVVAPSTAAEFPDVWVRIARSGNSLTLSTSPNGSNFTSQHVYDITGWGYSTLQVGPFLVSGAADTNAHGRVGEVVTAAFPDTATATEGQPKEIDVLANDSTQGVAVLTQITQPRFGTASITGGNTVSYDPETYWGWDGDVIFDYTFEEEGSLYTSTITVTVQALTQTTTPLPGSFFDGLENLGAGTGTGRRISDTGLMQLADSGSSGINSAASSPDGMTFAYEEVVGDFKAIVNLRDLSGGDTARAGLMLRETSGTQSRTVLLGADSLCKILAQARLTQGAAADSEQASVLPAMTFPNCWLRLERWRDTVRLFASTDGSSYSQIGQTVTLPNLAGNVRIGLFTFGGVPDTGATADFAHYTLEIETEPGIASAGTIDNGSTHDLASLGTDDWVIWGQFGTGQMIRKNGGSGRIGNLAPGSQSTLEPLDFTQSIYNELTWVDGEPVASGNGETHGVVIRGAENDPATVEIPVGRGEGTVHVIFSVDNDGANNMRGQATVISSEPGVDPVSIAPLQTNEEGYNVRFDYVSAREDTVLTVQMAKILDDSPGEEGIFVPQALAISRTEIPGGDGGPPFFVPVNTAVPEAVDDEFTIVGESSWLLDVTANDTDPDLWQGTPLLDALGTLPSQGTAKIQGGNVSYTPLAGFYGTDTFTYTVTDGGFTSDEATATITVLDPSDPADSDNDGLPDVFELAAYGDLSRDGSDDFDGDGVSDLDEVMAGRNPGGVDRITYDFHDDFERGPGSLPHFPGLWSIGSGTTAEIKSAIGTEASHGLELFATGSAPAELSLYLPVHWREVSWKQFDAILVPFATDADNPAVDSDTAIAFYLTESGDLRIRDGAAWRALGLSLDTTAMHRYTVRQDYIAQTWKLWIDGSLVTDPPAAFANPRSAPAFVRLSHTSDEPAVFDNVAISGTPLNGGTLAALLTFDTWSSNQTWNGTDSSATGDPNTNTLPNLLEYAFGFADPVNGTHAYATGMTLDESGPVLTLTYRRNRDAEDLAFTVQTSPDLTTWTNLEPGTADITVTPSSDPDVDLIAVTVPITADNLFVRLRVSSE